MENKKLKGIHGNTKIYCKTVDVANKILNMINYDPDILCSKSSSLILGVKREFKVGDRVSIKTTSEYYGEDSLMNPTGGIGTIINDEGYNLKYESEDFNARVKWDNGKLNSYNLKKDLELVSEAKPTEEKQQFLTISRKNLSEIYINVCTSWQSNIDILLKNSDPFSNEVRIPLEIVLKGYGDANTNQLELLRKYLPLLKVKVEKTVEVNRWINIYDDYKTKSIHDNKESAMESISGSNKYITTIELKGSYTTVEEKEMEFEYNLPF